MFRNYNFRWWLQEQLSKGEENWQLPTKEKKWYKCITKNTVSWDKLSGIYYNENGGSDSVRHSIIDYYEMHNYMVDIRESVRAGYLVKSCFAIMPYLGQWGRGWIMATHKYQSYVTIYYILIRRNDDVIQS